MSTSTVDLGRYAHLLDQRREWNGPAYVGPGGVYCLSRNVRNTINPWTVHIINPDASTVRPVFPYASFEAARAAARGFASE